MNLNEVGADTTPPVALSIAGSDSGGGAGIEADLKTFSAHGVFGTVAVTAITAQNSKGVTAIELCSPEIVLLQLDAVLSDLPVKAVKTGMLATEAIVTAIAELAATGSLPHLVVDPVMVATSGATLLDPGAVHAYAALLAHALITTPNIDEAAVLAGIPVFDLTSMREAARALSRLGTKVVVVKGGHLRGAESIDVVCIDGEIEELHALRVASENLHGTGCTLSAAITAELALGADPWKAIIEAKSYVSACIAASSTWKLGAGAGPLDHITKKRP